MRRRISFFSLVLILGGACLPARAQSKGIGKPIELRVQNPLTLSLPVLEEPLRFPKDLRTVDSKIAASLWQKLQQDRSERPVRVIVQLREPVQTSLRELGNLGAGEMEAVRAAAVQQNFVQAATAQGFRALGGLSRFPVVFGEVEAGRVAALAGLPQVERVFEDEPVAGQRAEGGALIRSSQLRAQLGGTGRGIGVAVLDTGIFPHAEFGHRIVAEADLTETTGAGTEDDNGHGTAVAGIVAGSQGMAPEANLWAIKVLNSDAKSTTSTVLAGLDLIYAHRADYGGLHVVNLSLGGGLAQNADCDATSPYSAVLSRLEAAGVAILVASGNNGSLNGILEPACHSKTISVGAVYDGDIGAGGALYPNVPACPNDTTGADQIACYSNSGLPLDVLGPGECAVTTSPDGGYYSCFNGTSAATPYVAGVVAQILSLRPGTTPSEVREALMATGRPLTDAGGLVRHRIDAVAAYQALVGGSGDQGNQQEGDCIRNTDTACLLSGRFEVKVEWKTATGRGTAKVMSFSGQRSENEESVFWYFFNPGNFEMGVKILNACNPTLGNKFWVFVSGLTNQGWTVKVRDTVTDTTKIYSNPVNQLSETFTDTQAFECR